MAIVDVRVLRTLKITESKSDKSTIQLTASQQLLFISDSRDPAFNEILDDSNSWANLGGGTVPQIDDSAVVKGIEMFVTSRELAYYQDNERAVAMTIRYDAKAPEEQSGDKPSGTEPVTWQKISISTQQMTKPAIGYASRGSVPNEDVDDEPGSGAQNSAGDPVDGLEEDVALLKYVYTNTQVLNPNFEELNRYTNRCNNGEFLGAGDYTLRMTGWSGEYDQKNNVWTISVEFLFNPNGWQVYYFDVGYNEIVDGQRRAILDQAGNPVGKPVPLNGAGEAQTINASPADDEKPTEPLTLEMYPYKIADFGPLFDNCGI